MASATMSKPKKAGSKVGFTLPCPACGETDVTINLDLGDLATCTCASCDDAFSVHTACKQLRERLTQWEAVAAWVALAGDMIPVADDSAE